MLLCNWFAVSLLAGGLPVLWKPTKRNAVSYRMLRAEFSGCATWLTINSVNVTCRYQEPQGQFILAVALYSYTFQEVCAKKMLPWVVEVICKWRLVDSADGPNWEVLLFALLYLNNKLVCPHSMSTSLFHYALLMLCQIHVFITWQRCP